MKGWVKAVSIFVLLNALFTSIVIIQGTLRGIGSGPSTGIINVPGGFGFYRCNPISDEERTERCIGQLFLLWLIALPVSIGLWKLKRWAMITEIVLCVLAFLFYSVSSLIVGLPIIIILSTALTKLPKPRELKCQNCGAPFETGMAFCLNCGSKLLVEIPQKFERRCPNPNCKQIIPEKAKFCRYCGTKLENI